MVWQASRTWPARRSGSAPASTTHSIGCGRGCGRGSRPRLLEVVPGAETPHQMDRVVAPPHAAGTPERPGEGLVHEFLGVGAGAAERLGGGPSLHRQGAAPTLHRTSGIGLPLSFT
jgi:hypothetical protein